MNTSKPIHVTKPEEFEKLVLKSDKPVIVDFYADWCGPCQVIAPELEKALSNSNGKFSVVKVNVDDAEELATQYGVSSIPLVILFKNGQKHSEFVGFKKESLDEMLEAAKSG